MQSQEATPRDSEVDRDVLLQQVRTLQERLTFYEGFDLLIQDNVAHARELFRLAAQERETAATAVDRATRESGQRETHLRAELERIASDLNELSHAVEALSQRVARALGAPSANGWAPPVETHPEQSVAVVVHGVPSARTALSLQRFVASLPQVAAVSAREFAGGVLRLDVRAQDRLLVDEFFVWDDQQRIQPLTERADVIEFALSEGGGVSG